MKLGAGCKLWALAGTKCLLAAVQQPSKFDLFKQPAGWRRHLRAHCVLQ